MTRAVIVGCGSYLPQKIVTNKDLESIVETDDAWIRERTGIEQRHIAADDEYTSDIGAKAALAALKHAGIAPEAVDMVLLATATPDTTFPSAATALQDKAGLVNAAAMDVNAACSGFVYGLHLADALIKAGSAKTIVVVGAETMSRVVDWADRRTCVLFGDGAGAVVVQAMSDEVAAGRGILSSAIFSDGSLRGILATDGGVSSTKTAGVLFMEGQEVFRHAVSKMAASAGHVMQAAQITAEDVTWVVPHQANMRILTATTKKTGLPEDKLIATVNKHANTSSASIPLALADAVMAGKLQQGNIVVMPALGAGLTWGTCIIRW